MTHTSTRWSGKSSNKANNRLFCPTFLFPYREIDIYLLIHHILMNGNLFLSFCGFWFFFVCVC
ncbi:hypothetical protein Hanom_Chr17g01540941 [Helianthus anomalus]